MRGGFLLEGGGGGYIVKGSGTVTAFTASHCNNTARNFGKKLLSLIIFILKTYCSAYLQNVTKIDIL